MKRIRLTSIIIVTLFSISAYSQGYDPERYSAVASTEKLESYVSFLANDICRGRQTGTRGGQISGSYIKDHFEKFGLEPYKGSYYQSFAIDSTIGRNILGIIPAFRESDEYIVISAHYDYIGTLDGKIYNGADDNASGVSVLLGLAEIFSVMKREGTGPSKNIIFAAFDAKEMNMSGSTYFLNTLNIPSRKVLWNLNIDQIGSTFAPPSKSQSYILILGADKRASLRDRIDFLNVFSRSYLDVDFTFYGSRAFASIFYRASDQSAFTDRGIPALLFTSGITAHTYKPSDDYDLLNYEVMTRRLKLIYFIAMDLMNT